MAMKNDNGLTQGPSDRDRQRSPRPLPDREDVIGRGRLRTSGMHWSYSPGSVSDTGRPGTRYVCQRNPGTAAMLSRRGR
jgi:hypothetical protein